MDLSIVGWQWWCFCRPFSLLRPGLLWWQKRWRWFRHRQLLFSRRNHSADPRSLPLHLGFVTGASVLVVLADFHSLHHFPEGNSRSHIYWLFLVCLVLLPKIRSEAKEHLHSWKIHVLSIEYYVDYFPSTPNISVYCLLTPSVSVENSSIRLIIAPLKLIFFFLLVTFKGPWDGDGGGGTLSLCVLFLSCLFMCLVFLVVSQILCLYNILLKVWGLSESV